MEDSLSPVLNKFISFLLAVGSMSFKKVTYNLVNVTVGLPQIDRKHRNFSLLLVD